MSNNPRANYNTIFILLVLIAQLGYTCHPSCNTCKLETLDNCITCKSQNVWTSYLHYNDFLYDVKVRNIGKKCQIFKKADYAYVIVTMRDILYKTVLFDGTGS